MAKFIFLGPPGAGKGTQSAIVAQEMNLAHISTGEILRSAVDHKTSLGLEAQGFMARGELVPDALVLNLVKERLESLNGSPGWILDGFPRNTFQAQALDQLLQEMRQLPPMSDAATCLEYERRIDCDWYDSLFDQLTAKRGDAQKANGLVLKFLNTNTFIYGFPTYYVHGNDDKKIEAENI